MSSPAPRVTITTKTCSVVLSADPPALGYAAQFQRVNADGTFTNVGVKDAALPITRSTTINKGAYAFRVVWTKTGAPTIYSEIATCQCPDAVVVPIPTPPVPVPIPTPVPVPTPTPIPVPVPVPTPPSTAGLVQPADLTVLGSLRLPAWQGDANSFAYGGYAAGMNQQTGTLFLSGHDHHHRIAELSLPPTDPNATTLAQLPVAKYVQPLTDVFQGKLGTLIGGTARLGGFVLTPAGLIVSAWVYYDNGGQMKSHFIVPQPLTAGGYTGPLQLMATQAGFVSGWIAQVPPELQAALGGDLAIGNGGLPIITRTSFGPALTIVNAADIGTPAPIPATAVLEYPCTGASGPNCHATLGQWASTGQLFNGCTVIAGAVFIPGTRTVLFPVRRGMGPFCYGEGTPAQPPGIDSVGNAKCYDPTDSSKGNHAYPYETWIYAYDVNDLIAVKQGTKQRWDVLPYATWKIDLPFATPKSLVTSCAYHVATKRLYLVTGYVDAGGVSPLVHVLQVK